MLDGVDLFKFRIDLLKLAMQSGPLDLRQAVLHLLEEEDESIKVVALEMF